MQRFNEEQSGKAASHLISHLVSSAVHFVFSLVLCFFWMDPHKCVGVGAGPSYLFGGLTFGYSSITVILFALTISHLGFKPRSPKMLAVTTIATSTASAAIAVAGIVVFEVLINDARTPCAFSTLYYISLVFLVIFMALDILLFVVSLLHYKQMAISERKMNEPKNSIRPSWKVHESQFDRPTYEVAGPDYSTWRRETAQVQRSASSASSIYEITHKAAPIEYTINEPPNSDYDSWRKRKASFRMKLATISEASIPEICVEQRPVRLSMPPYSPSSLYPMDKISPDTSFDHLDDLNATPANCSIIIID